MQLTIVRKKQVARVKPLNKKGDIYSIQNYTPI